MQRIRASQAPTIEEVAEDEAVKSKGSTKKKKSAPAAPQALPIRSELEFVQHSLWCCMEGSQEEVRCAKGVDPRMLGEAGRGLIRFAEFAGLMDRAPETTQANTTLIQLSAPTDGANFGERWSGGETVDVKAESDPGGHESGHTAPQLPADASTEQQGPTVMRAVEGSKVVQRELL